MCLSGLQMGVNTVCTLNMDGKHDLLTIFSSRGQKKPQLSLSCRACEVAGDVSQQILMTSLKFGDITNL